MESVAITFRGLYMHWIAGRFFVFDQKLVPDIAHKCVVFLSELALSMGHSLFAHALIEAFKHTEEDV